MAYLYGNASNTVGLYSALASFLVDSGWTLVDTLSSKDKVFKSSGEDGKCNNVMRLRLDDAAEDIKGADDPANAISWIQMLGSHGWNLGTHTPIRPFGTIGPWMLTNYFNTNLHFWQRDAVAPMAQGWTRQVTTNYPGIGFTNGRSVFFSMGQSDPSQHGFLSEGTGSYVLPMSSLSNSAGNGVWVYDPLTDSEYLYCAQSSGWVRYDLTSGAQVNLANPINNPLTATSSMVWDGGDFIYAIFADGSAAWERYSISANSWTAMTPLPAVTGYYNPPSGALHFVPAGVCGAWAEDVVLVVRKNELDSVFVWGVTTGNWLTSVHLPRAVGTYEGFGLGIDRQEKKIYFYHAPTQAMSRGDCSAGWPTSWSSYTTYNNGSMQGTAILPLTWPLCRVRGHKTDLISYWFVGNKNRVIVVTKVKGHYYWAYFGKYISAVKPLQMKLTQDVGSGSPVVVDVVSTDSFVSGEDVNVMDPATGTWERTTISSIISPTSLSLPLAQGYGVNSIISADWPLVACSDCLMGTLPVSVLGYRTNSQTDFCRLRPLIDAALAPATINARGQYQLGPVGLAQNQAPAELKGQLDGVYSLTQGSLTSEDTVTVGGKTYLFIHDNEQAYFETRQYVIGPLE